MGKKSGPQAPAAPDPAATAAAQAQTNREAAIAQANLNRINQYTPQGSLVYNQIGTNADGTPQYSQTQTYSPEQQALYDQQNQIALSLGGLAQNNVARVNQAQSTPFSYEGMTPLQTGVQAPRGQMQYGPQAQQLQTSLPNSGEVQDSFNTGRGVEYMGNGAGGDIQRNLDFSNLPSLPGVSDFGSEAQRVQDAVYSQAASRLDPRFQQQESGMRARLAASGIAENSEAYKREMDNFERTRNDGYNQAVWSAIQAGGSEQSRLFGLAMAARQQGVGETTTQGNFANNAQQQGYAQIAQRLGLNNAAAGQEYAQNQGAAAFNNTAQDQRFTQGLAGGEFNNNALNTMFQQGQQATATNNTARAQEYNENLSNLNVNNQARQQQIQEATYLRNLPLNEIAALLGTGGSVTNPVFNNVAQVGVAAPDYQGAVYQNYNAQMNQYNQAQQARSSMLGSIFGGIGSIGSAIALSDARLKENIVPIMRDALGLMWYTFNYIGGGIKQFGVMAQDVLKVMPEAVVELENGYLAVDYGKVRYGV